MGHYLSELYPRGYEVEMREEREREAKREKVRRERATVRYKRQDELMEISGEELPQTELRKRISTMIRRYKRVTSVIPASVTLHLKDGEDIWEVSGFLRESGAGRFSLTRDEHTENEHFDFYIDGRGKEAGATHGEKGLFEISMSSRDSEREVRPAEELLDRLLSPLEEKMGIKPKAARVVFQA